MLTREEFESLYTRDLSKNPLYYFEDQDFHPTKSRFHIYGWIIKVELDTPSSYSSDPSVVITLSTGNKTNVSFGSNISMIQSIDCNYLIRNYQTFIEKGLGLPLPIA